MENYDCFLRNFNSKFGNIWNDSIEILATSDDSLYSETIYIYKFEKEILGEDYGDIDDIFVEFTYKTRDYSSDDWNIETFSERISIETLYRFLKNRLYGYEEVSNYMQSAIEELFFEYPIDDVKK